MSMKFNGQSAVEVHPHSNLDELKAVTSISFYIRVDPDKDPIEDRFLLYLGDKQVSTSKKNGPEISFIQTLVYSEIGCVCVLLRM